MARKREGLVPIGEAISDLDGPVKGLRDASPQARHHCTRFDQVNQLIEASEADPDLGFMARLMALCSQMREVICSRSLRGSIQFSRRQGGEYGIGFEIKRQADDGLRGGEFDRSGKAGGTKQGPHTVRLMTSGQQCPNDAGQHLPSRIPAAKPSLVRRWRGSHRSSTATSSRAELTAISGPTVSLRVIFHTVAAQAPRGVPDPQSPVTGRPRARER